MAIALPTCENKETIKDAQNAKHDVGGARKWKNSGLSNKNLFHENNELLF